MICNLRDLNAAIDWLERENIPDPLLMMNDNEIHMYRGRMIWRPALLRRRGDFYLLGKAVGDPIMVAPWVIDEMAKLATVET